MTAGINEAILITNPTNDRQETMIFGHYGASGITQTAGFCLYS